MRAYGVSTVVNGQTSGHVLSTVTVHVVHVGSCVRQDSYALAQLVLIEGDVQ